MIRIALLVAALSGVAWAGEPEGDEGKAAEPAQTTAPAPAPAAPSTDKPASSSSGEPAPAPTTTWHAFGYLRMQYIAVQDDPNVAFVGRDDGFELQNARLGVTGQVAPRLSYLIAIDGAVDERAQINVPQGKLKVALRDAFVDAMLTPQLAVHAGYFQTWVDPEGLVLDTERELVDRPIESRGMRATEGWQTPGLPPGRSLGAALRVDPKPVDSGAALGFELAVQNGADEFSSNNDNNLPALSAAALVRLPQHGFVVAAARWNPRTVGELPFRQDETDLQGSLGAHVALGPLSLGGGVIVQHTTYESTGGPSQNAYGAHAQVMFVIPAALPLGIGYRFGILDPSSLITTDQVMEHTVGAVLGVPSVRMRVQLQAVHVQEQAARELDNDRVQVAAEVSL